MKKLICYFVLISSFLCGVGGASSSGISKGARKRVANSDPKVFVNMMFEQGAKNYDYKSESRLKATADIIKIAYEGNRTKQIEAVNSWADNVRKLTVNGKKKYTEQDVNLVVNYSKHRLNLK